MQMFEPTGVPFGTRGPGGFRRSGGFSLTELLVAVAIILILGAMATAAVSASGSSQKKFRTRALIAKIDVVVAAQYASYAGRSVEAATGAARGEALRAIARGDLPDNWEVVADLAMQPVAGLTAHQRAYAAIWNALSAAMRQSVPLEHSSAECLFMAVMQGGLADCLDCQSLRIDVGDRDADGFPEFLDAWGNPIGFVHEPAGLQLPAGSGELFFSSALPFDPVVASPTDAKGGLMRPLIVSGGPDGAFGLEPDAGPTPGSKEQLDNVTNFDEEAKR